MAKLGKTLALLLVIVFVASVVIFHPVTVKASSSRTITVPDDYPTIQAAIDNASAGDTILVRSGNYNQSLTINKTISLIGENQQTTTLTMPLYYSPNVGRPEVPDTYTVNLQANNAIICNFTIENPNVEGTGINSVGDFSQISDIITTAININGANQIISNSQISFLQLSASSISNLIIGNAFTGPIFLSGSQNVISDSSITSTTGTGILLKNANSNLIKNDVIIQGGIVSQNSNSNIIYNNTIGGGLELGDPNYGSASNNLIVKNTISGIYLTFGNNNVIYANFANNNSNSFHSGLIIFPNANTNSNLFYCNNINGLYVYSQATASNSFDNGTVGNYWDDYLTKYPNATEVDNSGIGDTPYLLYGNTTDNYPLMAPFDISNINLQLPSWTNSLPTQRPIPTFLPENPASSHLSPTPTSSIALPEFPALAILPLLLFVLSVAVILRHRKITNKKVKKI